MNLYLDTSSLAKLYIEEPDSAKVHDAVKAADVTATSAISYVEMHSLVARRRREKLIRTSESRRILDMFELDWSRYGRIAIDASLLKTAGRLIARHPLRALDAVQLASALAFQDALEEPIAFLTADVRLQAAARKEKLSTP